MKKIGYFLTLLIAVTVLFWIFSPGKIQEPLVTGDFNQMNVFIADEKVYGTTDLSLIKNSIKSINTSRRETTYDWGMTPPIGKIVFKGKADVQTLQLFESGGVTLNEFFIYTEFDYLANR